MYILSCFSHVWLFNPMDCSPPGFSLHGILRARILECIAISFSTESFWLRDQIHVSYVSCIGRRVLYQIVDKSMPLRVFQNMFRDTGLMLRIAWLRAHPLNPCPPYLHQEGSSFHVPMPRLSLSVGVDVPAPWTYVGLCDFLNIAWDRRDVQHISPSISF